MYAVIALLLLITGQALLAEQSEEAAVEMSPMFFSMGHRLDGDQLLLKDVQHSRPASIGEPSSVTFNYNIAEPITEIAVFMDVQLEASVKLSYVDTLVVGMVRLDNSVDSSLNQRAFALRITIYGFNDSQAMLNVDSALLLARDTQYEGPMIPDENSEVHESSEQYDLAKREDLQVDIEDNERTEDYVRADDYETTDAPTFAADFELKDKIIEVGQRQAEDDLIYETYQTSPDVSKEQTNHTVIFYYIDSDYITYVKFVIFDHFSDKLATAEDYTAPVAEYSHYSPGTLKATITDFNISSLFVQMFVYGYRGRESPPNGYKPFLTPPHTDLESRTPYLTPLQRVQLLLMTGRSTTHSPQADELTEDSEEDGAIKPIRPEDMVPNHVPEPSIKNSAFDQQPPVQQRLYAMLGLMLFAVA